MGFERTKKLWTLALKNKNVEEIVSCYARNFIFKGTFKNKPTKERKELVKYFNNLTKKVDGVTFLKNNVTLTKNNITVDSGNYNFRTKEGVIKASYIFNFDKDGKIISHVSNLRD